MINKIYEKLPPLRNHLKPITKTIFWITTGSTITLNLTPPTSLTIKLLPLELGILLGVTLAYLSYSKPNQNHQGEEKTG